MFSSTLDILLILFWSIKRIKIELPIVIYVYFKQYGSALARPWVNVLNYMTFTAQNTWGFKFFISIYPKVQVGIQWIWQSMGKTNSTIPVCDHSNRKKRKKITSIHMTSLLNKIRSSIATIKKFNPEAADSHDMAICSYVILPSVLFFII